VIVSADQSSILFDNLERYANAIIFELDWNIVWLGECGDWVYEQVSLTRSKFAQVKLTLLRTTVLAFGSTSLISRT
jgi:hypothetical protein